MNPASGLVPTLQSLRWWSRLHRELMPDYNRKATVYWWSVVVLGSVTLIGSMVSVADDGPLAWGQIAMGMVIAMFAGIFPVRVPQSKNSFAAGEIFIFLLLLLHGPEAATLAAAGEAAVGSWRTSKRWTSRIASPAMAALAMYGAGTLLNLVIGRVVNSAGLLILATMAFALVYFVFNIFLVTAVPRLKRNERMQWSDLFGVFGWIGIAYAGSAAVAVLLFLTYQQSGIGVLMAMVPLLAMMLATLHYFFRQQEAAEAVRKAGAEASGREAELAARHVRANFVNAPARKHVAAQADHKVVANAFELRVKCRHRARLACPAVGLVPAVNVLHRHLLALRRGAAMDHDGVNHPFHSHRTFSFMVTQPNGCSSWPLCRQSIGTTASMGVLPMPMLLQNVNTSSISANSACSSASVAAFSATCTKPTTVTSRSPPSPSRPW